MRYLSVCSGIEAATVAWHHMGWQPVAFSDIEPFPSAVLAHHYPHVPNLGDMTKFEEWNLESVDLLVGGTPCQSFSVAGFRKGLADPRGNLMLTFLAIAQRQRPRWIVWENVPGVLSSNGGRDFGTFLKALGELGYGFAYRVLDAQWFGVAQRRRRVFVVGYLGDWQRAAKVLFERESVCRNPAPSREARQAITRSSKDRLGSGGIPEVAETLIATDHKGPGHNGDHNFITQPIGFGAQMSEPQTDVDLMQTLNAKNPMAVAQPVYGTDCYNGAITGDVAATLGTPGSSVNASGPTVMQPIAFKPGQSAAARSLGAQVNIACTLEGGGGGNNKQAIAQPVATDIKQVQWASGGGQLENDTAQALRSNAEHNYQFARIAMQVRRLTPVECERLQGFPDGYTNIPWRKKPESPDGPRYKALGNSMAVPVMRWIGERINKEDKL
jgi:DNA (cytosine-5)-methyltransferase 1